MSNEYHIVRVDNGDDVRWDSVQSADIGNYPWDSNGYTPKAYAKMYCTGDSFHIRLRAFEKVIKSVYANMNDPVYKDSCLEFFIQPVPLYDDRYLNFELNPRGTLLLGLGKGRNDRTPLGAEVLTLFDIKTFLKASPESNEWGVEFRIPYDFLRRMFPDFRVADDTIMKGNFYKCGDETQFPHYGCWNPVASDFPDFHLPRYFGTLAVRSV